jgi:hypothetical protein
MLPRVDVGSVANISEPYASYIFRVDYGCSMNLRNGGYIAPNYTVPQTKNGNNNKKFWEELIAYFP